MRVNLEQAVSDFLAIANRCVDAASSARVVVNEITKWYRDVRVDGASLDEDGDMLLVQWGADEVLDLLEPLDLRGLGDARIRNLPEAFSLDCARQVCAPSDDEESFDDNAVQMHITLTYDLDDGLSDEGNMWIRTPEQVQVGVSKLATHPVLSNLLDRTPQKFACYVEHCG